MGILALLISLAVSVFSLLQAGFGAALSSIGAALSGDEAFYTSGGSALFVMLAALLGFIGGVCAAARSRSSVFLLGAAAALCALAAFAGIYDNAWIYTAAYAVCALLGNAAASKKKREQQEKVRLEKQLAETQAALNHLASSQSAPDSANAQSDNSTGSGSTPLQK